MNRAPPARTATSAIGERQDRRGGAGARPDRGWGHAGAGDVGERRLRDLARVAVRDRIVGEHRRQRIR